MLGLGYKGEVRIGFRLGTEKDCMCGCQRGKKITKLGDKKVKTATLKLGYKHL